MTFRVLSGWSTWAAATACYSLRSWRSIRSSKAHLFDAQSVIDGAQDLVNSLGVGGRCELAGGDFFVSVPAGGDAYIMKHIIHDWEDERALTILRNCHL